MSEDAAIVAQNTVGATVLEQVVVNNDLSKLSPAQRLEYYRGLCASLGLNPLTRPFQYITLGGKLTLYATRDATDQLRKGNEISIQIVAREMVGGIYVVTARAVAGGSCRQDESTGAVAVAGLRGEALANAYMKAETKAKRRVTLSICGLGMSDETEVVTIPGASLANVDMETGEVMATPAPRATESFNAGEWLKSIGGTKRDFDRLCRMIAERSDPAQTWGLWFHEAAGEGCSTIEELDTYLAAQLAAEPAIADGEVLDDEPGEATTASDSSQAETPQAGEPFGDRRPPYRDVFTGLAAQILQLAPDFVLDDFLRQCRNLGLSEEAALEKLRKFHARVVKEASKAQVATT